MLLVTLLNNSDKQCAMKGTEYEHLYALKNKDTGKWVLTYWASSQKHKALFSTRKKAEDAVNNIKCPYNVDANIEIVEL